MRGLNTKGGYDPQDRRRKVEVKKEKEIINSLTLVDYMDLRKEMKEAVVVLNDSMYRICRIHSMNFQNTLEKHKEAYERSLRQGVSVALANTP